MLNSDDDEELFKICDEEEENVNRAIAASLQDQEVYVALLFKQLTKLPDVLPSICHHMKMSVVTKFLVCLQHMSRFKYKGHLDICLLIHICQTIHIPYDKSYSVDGP